jgi:hypothetical protein
MGCLFRGSVRTEGSELQGLLLRDPLIDIQPTGRTEQGRKQGGTAGQGSMQTLNLQKNRELSELNVSPTPPHRLKSFLFLKKFFLRVVLGLELRAFTLSHSTSPFCVRYFQDRVSWTICLGWLQTSILLMVSSWVARIIGVSNWHLTTGWNLDSQCDSIWMEGLCKVIRSWGWSPHTWN